MSNQIVLEAGVVSPGLNIYYCIQDLTGNIWLNNSASTFQIPLSFDYTTLGGNTMPEVGGNGNSGQYQANMPPTIVAGTYVLQSKQRVGASFALTDPIVKSQKAYWDGTDLLDPAYASVIGAGAVSATFVEDSHIWRFSARDQMTAENVINEVVDFIGILAMNFDNVISKNVRIQSALVDSIDGDTGTSSGIDTTGSVQLSPNNRIVLVPVQVYDDGTYTFIIKITTTDTQTFVRRGVVSITSKVET